MPNLRNRVKIPVQNFRVTLPPPLWTRHPSENQILRRMHKSNRPPSLHLLRRCSLPQLPARFIQSRELSCSLTFLNKMLLTLRLRRSAPLFPFNPCPPTDRTITQALPPPPPPDAADPLDIPLPHSPLSSPVDSPSTPPLPESKRRPQIVLNVTTNNTKENAEDATRGRSLATKSSLPALSPTMTASSFSSIPTPRDDESMERIETIIARSSSGKSRASRLGKVSPTGRDSEDLDVVHETIPETPEPTATESKTWSPNRESTPTIGAAGFEAFVERREKRRISTGIFHHPSKKGSGSISRKSTGTERSFRWGSIANDFSLKPLDGRRSRSSTLLVSTPFHSRFTRLNMVSFAV